MLDGHFLPARFIRCKPRWVGMVVVVARVALVSLLLASLATPVQAEDPVELGPYQWIADAALGAPEAARSLAGPIVSDPVGTAVGDGPAPRETGETGTRRRELVADVPITEEGAERMWTLLRIRAEETQTCIELVDGFMGSPSGPVHTSCIRRDGTIPGSPVDSTEFTVINPAWLAEDAGVSSATVSIAVEYTYDCSDFQAAAVSDPDGSDTVAYMPFGFGDEETEGYPGMHANGVAGFALNAQDTPAVLETTVSDGKGMLHQTRTVVPGLGHLLGYLDLTAEDAFGQDTACA